MTACVAYVRVSTEEQAVNGGGLVDQRALIEAWARRENRVVVRWCADEGRSGSLGVDVRDGLADALATLGAACPEMVVPRLDRLARDLILQEQLLVEVRRLGGQLRSCVAEEDRLVVGDDGDDPSRKLVRQILGAVAEYERAVIRLRLVTGKRRKLLRGGYIGGTLRYGWRVRDDGILEIADGTPEGAVVRRVMALREEGWTWNRIAKQLTADGVPTPTQPADRRLRRRAWRHQRVMSIVGEWSR